jgi:hypothetical protein
MLCYIFVLCYCITISNYNYKFIFLRYRTLGIFVVMYVCMYVCKCTRSAVPSTDISVPYRNGFVIAVYNLTYFSGLKVVAPCNSVPESDGTL